MHHTIIAVDVEGFGRRDGPHQTKVREGLNAAARLAFDHCGLRWEQCQIDDRGDGLRILVPPDVDSARLAECLPNELAGCLRRYNATVDLQAKIRLRIVIHSGEIGQDCQGPNGPALVHAARLLDSPDLKQALARSSGILALITSDEFFRDVIAPDPAANPAIYRRVTVAVKETHAKAWICLPDHHGPLRTRREPHGRHRMRRKPRAWRGPRIRRIPAGVATMAVLLLVGGFTENVLSAAPPADLCPEPVQLNVTVSAEKMGVIRDLAVDFEDAERDERGCKGVAVQVTTAGSSDEVIAAIRGGWAGADDLKLLGPEPHVLLPDSSLEYQAAVRALRDDESDEVSLRNHGSIATSPIVLARASRGVTAAGDPPASWEDVLRAAGQDLSTLGTLTYRPSPVASGTGLLATVALYSALLGRDLDRENLAFDGAPRVLHLIEQAVETGDESSTLLCWLFRQPGGTVLVSEKVAADFNEGVSRGERCPPDEGARVDISVPSEGTLYLDHPFVTVDWHSRPRNPAREQAAHRFHEYLVGPHGQDALRLARFRDLDWNVTPGRGVLEREPERLELGEVDATEVLKAFDRARMPARVLVLVDASRMMSEPFLDVGGNRLRAAADAVERALGSVGSDDKVGLWAFAAGLGGAVDHRVLLPLGRGGTEKTSEALGELRDTASRQPRVYGALRAAAASLRESHPRPADTKEAVLVIADGAGEEREDHTPLVEELRASGVPVFLIAFRAGVCGSTRWQEITSGTDGVCQEVTTIDDIDEALDKVGAVLWGGGNG